MLQRMIHAEWPMVNKATHSCNVSPAFILVTAMCEGYHDGSTK